jgi:deoxyribodipyrimidine photo-lyase
LNRFIKNGLPLYRRNRNNPVLGGQSGLSPYLHFGHISAQRIALEITSRAEPDANADAFLEELIVRRELSDNFCFYNGRYDSFEGFPDWAKNTLLQHALDPRPAVVTFRELEQGETRDPMWNAAQMEMVKTGKMHGYMRMYWAKKILEWSPRPEEALETALVLNDKYELDGCDPNGAAGCAWSIGGVHDRAWGERPVFGKIRAMSAGGLESKMDARGYIKKIQDL